MQSHSNPQSLPRALADDLCAAVHRLDGCALNLPCHAGDELPVGPMVWASAMCDGTVLDVSLAIEHGPAVRSR